MATDRLQTEEPWSPGQRVRITGGPFAGMEGVIEWIDRQRGIVRVSVEVFGRQTPVELSFADLQALP
ncbi:MAG TPA: KOW motif-containing protein [Anaerolineaceae bacterium]|nr:KOW motif-containing protein [Anaerolineaceae bacterium]